MKHLADEFLVRAVDDELSVAERVELEEHLARCAACHGLLRELGALSIYVEHAVSNTPVAIRLDDEAALLSRLEGVQRQTRQAAARTSFALRWAAAAAAIACAFIVPLAVHHRAPAGHIASAAVGPISFDVDGETFVALPYSNPDLPLDSARIVQMQVPVSSLADAGIMVGPLSQTALDSSVLADILMGEDGEPRAVHVISE